MKILFDERKRQMNIEKHGLDLNELDMDFFEGAKFFQEIGPVVGCRRVQEHDHSRRRVSASRFRSTISDLDATRQPKRKAPCMAVKFSSKRALTDAEEAEIQRMIGSDPDNPEATDEQIAQAKPFRQAFPDLAASIDREKAKRGRPNIDNPKRPISLRLSPDVIDAFKLTGKGWQTRIDEALRKAVGL